jgi:thioredoxin reductase (NADPH)
MIPVSHNHAGFPDGISGLHLIERMREQALKYGAELRAATITNVSKSGDFFLCRSHESVVVARTVLFATGVHNRRPTMTTRLHDDAVRRGLLRYCPICDGYEVTDQPVAVIGQGQKGLAEAEFLRGFTANVTLISSVGETDFTAEQISRANDAGIAVVEEPYRGFRLGANRIHVALSSGDRTFSAVYPALGSDAQSKLAAALGVKVTEDRCVIVDAHQRSTLPGVYAAGDVVIGLDQISTAMGQASIAATSIRNDLAAVQPKRR